MEALKAKAEAGDQEAQSQLAEHKQYQVRATVKSYRKMRDDAIIVMDNEVWYCIDGLPNRCLAIW